MWKFKDKQKFDETFISFEQFFEHFKIFYEPTDKHLWPWIHYSRLWSLHIFYLSECPDIVHRRIIHKFQHRIFLFCILQNEFRFFSRFNVHSFYVVIATEIRCNSCVVYWYSTVSYKNWRNISWFHGYCSIQGVVHRFWWKLLL